MLNLERLETLSKRFDEIDSALANMGDTFDQARFTALVRERASISETVEAYRRYRRNFSRHGCQREALGRPLATPICTRLPKKRRQRCGSSARRSRRG